MPPPVLTMAPAHSPSTLQMATLEKAEELLEQLRAASYDAATRDLQV